MLKKTAYGLLILLFIFTGCASLENVGIAPGISVHSLVGIDTEDDSPRLYGGVRRDFLLVINPYLFTKGRHIHYIEIPIAWLYALIDLPLSCAGDTLFLPVNLYQIQSAR